MSVALVPFLMLILVPLLLIVVDLLRVKAPEHPVVSSRDGGR